MKKSPLILFFLLLGLAPGEVSLGQEQPQSRADSIQAENNQYLQALRSSIAGKENQPASEVFENIRIMTRSTAGRLLGVMNMGFSQSLGVSCTHCHVPDRWEIDEKPAKRTARAMSQMVTTINKDLLRSIADLKSENPIVNCTTCHRGQLKPALDLTR